jgi:hypothetical protein
MPTTVQITVYKFDELPKEAQEKAIEKLWDLNVDHDWWDSTYEDAKEIGLEITEFDTYRKTISGKLNEFLLDSCKAIRKNHSVNCDTFKTAKNYLLAYIAAFNKWRSVEWQKNFIRNIHNENEYDQWKLVDRLAEFKYSDEAQEIEDDYKKALLEDYLLILCKEYDYRTSREQIIESIRTNDYNFTLDGSIFN